MIAAVGLGTGSASAAIGPTDELRQYTDRVLEVLRAPGMSPAERRTAVRNLAIEVFDVAETARRALGPHWQQRTPAERADFVRLFRELLEQTYVSRIDEYGGERIQYTHERVDGDSAVVRAQILTKAGTTVPVESRLIQKNGHWLIYDILIENVSLVANYRSQFDRIIRTSSYDDLVKRLRERLAQLNQGVAEPARPAKPAR
jgi:phospholipid transport system substrate-binding protein